MKPSDQIDQHIAGVTDWRGPVLATIRRLSLGADPAVTEDWKWMGTPVWSCDGIVSLANPHAGKVKWTFAKGALFPDVDKLFNTGLEGNERRAIDIFEGDPLDEAALTRLVKTAIAWNRSRLQAKAGSKGTPKKAASKPAPKKATQKATPAAKKATPAARKATPAAKKATPAAKKATPAAKKATKKAAPAAPKKATKKATKKA